MSTILKLESLQETVGLFSERTGEGLICIGVPSTLFPDVKYVVYDHIVSKHSEVKSRNTYVLAVHEDTTFLFYADGVILHQSILVDDFNAALSQALFNKLSSEAGESFLKFCETVLQIDYGEKSFDLPEGLAKKTEEVKEETPLSKLMVIKGNIQI